jgi:hypothetical protein
MLVDPFSPRELARAERAGSELAQRRSGTDEVLLMWYPENERVELSIRDVTTGAGVHLDVALAVRSTPSTTRTCTREDVRTPSA